jgi:hypothetical protein
MVANIDRKVIGAVLLCLVLTLSLLLPALLTPQTTKAQDAEIYVLVQIPGLEKATTLKAAVEKVLYCNGVYAIVGCSEEQLTALQGDGYIISDNCTGTQDECLAQLSETLKSTPNPQTTGAPSVSGNFGYKFTDSTGRNICYNWIDITTTGKNTGINCDDCGVTVPIGFPFEFYGNSYTDISISSNGFLTFNGTGDTWIFWSQPIPDSDPPNNIICPFWDDLYSECSGSAIYYDTRLVGTDNAFIVEWVGNQFCCGCPQPYRLTFEAILYPDGNILFQYLDMSGPDRVDGNNASIGIENINGTDGLQYSYESPTISDGLAILFYTNTLQPNFNCANNIQVSRPKVSPSMPGNLTPPQISLQYLNITPKQTAASQPVTISTNVVNTGDQAGNYNVVLKINGQTEESRMVSVGPLTSQPVKFTVARSQPGTYTVDVGIQQGSFVVLGNEKSGGIPINGGLIAILALGVVAVIIVLMIVLRRPA